MIRAALVLVLCAAPVAAQEVRYSARCDDPWSDDRVILRGQQLSFHEAECDLTNGVAVPGMEGAATFDLVCEGEGDTWTDRVFLQPAFDGGLILVQRQFAQVIPRCP